VIRPEDLAALASGRHPARTLPFQTLRELLLRELEAGNVVRSERDGLELWTYTTVCQFDRRWTLASLLSRGLVLDPAASRVAATPFPKFFNWGEMSFDLPRTGFEVTEKVDGSLAILFSHAGAWRVVTKGAFESEQARWAGNWLRERCSQRGLRAGCTYLMEAVYPSNRIVVRYPFEGLVLLSAYDEEGVEFPRVDLAGVADACGFRLVSIREHPTIDGLLHVAEQLSHQEEGFVVRFPNGLRVKIKGREYCRIHKLISNCTPLAVWEGLLKGDDLDASLRDLPEEFRRDFQAIRGLLDVRLKETVDAIRRARNATAGLSDKALGLLLQSGGALPDGSVCPHEIGRFVFADRKLDIFRAVEGDRRTREGVFRLFRPGRNRLEGYTPSSAMNRFADADS